MTHRLHEMGSQPHQFPRSGVLTIKVFSCRLRAAFNHIRGLKALFLISSISFLDPLYAGRKQATQCCVQAASRSKEALIKPLNPTEPNHPRNGGLSLVEIGTLKSLAFIPASYSLACRKFDEGGEGGRPFGSCAFSKLAYPSPRHHPMDQHAVHASDDEHVL